jgi:hypothetical protein
MFFEVLSPTYPSPITIVFSSCGRLTTSGMRAHHGTSASIPALS